MKATRQNPIHPSSSPTASRFAGRLRSLQKPSLPSSSLKSPSSSASGMVAVDLSLKNSINRIVKGHSSMMNNYRVSELGNTQTSHLHGSPVLMHDTGFAADWSADEQRILEDGLIKFANEPPVMKYVKIAGLLADKTTRDVAMRCNWMKKKRRKQNQPTAGRTMTMRKEAQSKENLPAAPQLNMTSYSHATHNMNHTKQLHHAAYEGPLQNLLQQNDELFSRIDRNFSSFKLQENLELLRHTRNNILTILNNMTDLRGARSPMPPLPISINENLANIVLQDPIQGRMFDFHNGSFQA